jgi:hypothetical protein
MRHKLRKVGIRNVLRMCRAKPPNHALTAIDDAILLWPHIATKRTMSSILSQTRSGVFLIGIAVCTCECDNPTVTPQSEQLHRFLLVDGSRHKGVC